MSDSAMKYVIRESQLEQACIGGIAGAFTVRVGA